MPFHVPSALRKQYNQMTNLHKCKMVYWLSAYQVGMWHTTLDLCKKMQEWCSSYNMLTLYQACMIDHHYCTWVCTRMGRCQQILGPAKVRSIAIKAQH